MSVPFRYPAQQLCRFVLSWLLSFLFKPGATLSMPQTHQTIYSVATSCQALLQTCAQTPALMTDEWARRRVADFNLWASTSGASSKDSTSLDKRLESKVGVRNVVKNLLCLLEGLLRKSHSCCERHRILLRWRPFITDHFLSPSDSIKQSTGVLLPE